MFLILNQKAHGQGFLFLAVRVPNNCPNGGLLMRYTRHIGMRLAILLLFGGLCTVAHAKIVFQSMRNGNTDYHIYVMEDNGSNIRRVTSPDFYDEYPRWFPDGKRILFLRNWGGFGKIDNEFYIIDADGRNEHAFMENHPFDKYPVPSPDGTQVAFVGERAEDVSVDVYTYHLESKRLEQLTEQRLVYDLDWSPDGRQIAYDYTNRGDKESDIWTMNADGSRHRRFTPPQKKGLYSHRGIPRWSPSGKYIMYQEDESKGAGALVAGNWTQVREGIVVQHVLTGVRTVHKFPLADWVYSGCWMGDDQTLLLGIAKDWRAPGAANFEIYRYDLRNRQLTNLTNHPGTDHYPHWINSAQAVSPAGKLTTLWGKLKQTD